MLNVSFVVHDPKPTFGLTEFGHGTSRDFRLEIPLGSVRLDPREPNHLGPLIGLIGNKLAEKHDNADLWDIADGLLAGAIQYWLYARQPCGNPRCDECQPISTAEGRLSELRRLAAQFAEESEYYHSPSDSNVGRA